MLQVRRLVKKYGDLVAVAGVSFQVEAGRIYGLLGPNGAGKSTTIGCVSGLMPPTSGSVAILGHDVVSQGTSAKKELGIVPQEIALYEDLSARENLGYWAAAYGLRGSKLRERVGEVLGLVGLLDRGDEPIGRFSGGMKRRLNFACGIVHRPKLLLLDEPTVGVDPQSRFRLLELVQEQARQGVGVLYTTHYMEEAERVCHELGIIDRGKIIAAGTLDELRAMLGERDLLRLSGRFQAETAAEAIRGLEDTELVQCSDELLTIALKDGSQRLPLIFASLDAVGAKIRETTLKRPSLESLFIKLTGEELRE